MNKDQTNKLFIASFRKSAPYIKAFRHRTFVIAFSGRTLLSKDFSNLVHDIALLHTLGIRLVLVHGARAQIDMRLQKQQAQQQTINGIRVTDEAALECVKDAVGHTRTQVEALLSMGLANSPMAGVKLKVISGNFIVARPYGIHDGVDYLYTGTVRRVETKALEQQLDNDSIVLLSPVGYSPTGEVFNLTAKSVATETAKALKADKLIFLHDGLLATDTLKRELTLEQAIQNLDTTAQQDDETRTLMQAAIDACHCGVTRVHLINSEQDGALLQELFTRDGSGTMISADNYETLRQASIEDVAGILELIEPLEEQGILVRRSREHLEMEISNFTVMERDGMIIACAALYVFTNENRMTAAELACLAVHGDYRNQGRGDFMLQHVENLARQKKISQLFALSTQSSHWFLERGFVKAELEQLPVERKTTYNYQRNSKAYLKSL